MDNSKKKLIAFITVFLLLFTTFAYSALSTSLTITANAKFRVLANIRVDDIGLKSTNNSLISYDSEYTKNTISSGFKLTSTSSSIDYNVVVNNNGNIDQVIYQISTVSSNNDGIIIYIDDEPMNDKLPYKIPIGTTNIKITYKTTSPSNQTINIVNQFDFRKLYSVDYNSKGGSQIASQDKIEDVDLTLTNNVPTKQGYTFAGWTDEENGTTAKFQAGSKYTLNKSIILYALYTRNTYNITYTLNGGTNDSNNPSTYNVESNDITLKDASKAGWTFTGWTGNGTTTPTKNLKLSKGSTGNKTFVAHFEKTITLTQKHGTTTTTQNYNLKDLETEHTFTLQNSVDSFPGWTFDGWLNDPTPKAKDYSPTGSITISTDKTVYATYKKELTTTFIDYTGITKQTRTVKGTVYGNNNCGGVGNQYPIVTSLTVSNYTDWSKLGWTTSTSASASVSLNSNTNYTLTDDKATTYYALYKQDVTLTYNSNGGSTKPSDETKQRKVNSYSNTTFSHPTFTLKNTATKTGYTLSKWTISAPISADKNPTDSITIESGNSVTATAKWSANTYNISYTLNGGNNPSTKPASGTYDSNVQISNPNKTFTVNIDANSQSATIKNASGTAVTSASSTQTFAGWTSTVGTNAKTGTTTSDYVAWDGTSTTNTYFKNLTDTNNGTVTLTANWTAVNVTLPNITKTGYTCGYATSASGEVAYQTGGSYTPSTTTSSVTLFAKCNANPYTITYNGNGNTGGSTSSSSHTYDTAKKLTKNGFTKTGYVFAGWNTKANGTGTTYTDEQSVTNLATSGNITLYAQWTANTYTVAYTMNGAAAKANQSVSYDSNLTLAKPTKTFAVNIDANSQDATIKNASGTAVTSASSTQTFVGWTGTNLSSTAVYGNTTSSSTTWNGTTKIGANDATIYLKNLRTTSGTVTLTANWTAVNVTLPNITKTGYTCGYATSAGGNIAYQTGGSYTPSTTTGSVTLFAKCNANQYTVTYNGNGNTGGSTTASSHTYDEAKTLTKNGFTKTGYTFVGWNTKADGSGTNYEDEESVTNLATTGNFNLYAVWAPNTNTTYTVYHYIKDLGANTYSLNNTENKTGTSDASLTLANLKKTITGFTYSKGSLSGSTSGPGTVVTTTTIAADGTREIYLFYTRDTHTVTLTKGTGIATVTGAGTYEYGASVTINNTLNAGYSFVNWTVGTTSTAFATSQSKTFTMGTSDVTYKANGQLINYTITYNLNGGSVSTANPTTYNVTTDTFTLNNPTKTGYTFGGWTGSNGTTAQTSVSVAKGSTGNRTYTANYTAKTYTLTLKPNGGKYNNSTSDATKTMTYDSTNNNSIGTASKTGYTFTGWWTASSGGTQVYNANGQNVNASSYWTAAYNTGTWKYDGVVTLYAQFTKNDYSIAFNSNAPTGETATGTMANLAMKYDEAKNLTSNGYTISGYTFAGWNTKADGTGTAYLDGASVSNLATSGTVTLYAQWTVNTVTIGLQKDGSAYSNSGIKVTLYDGTTATSFTSTISSGSTATFTKVPAKTYNIYVGEDTNHKTTMVDSNVDVVVNSSSTSQTVKFYTLTIGLSNTTTSVNGTSVSNNGTVVVAEGYAHAVVAAANTGYEFVSNAVIWSNTGTMTIANTKASSTTVKLSSAGKLTSTATAKSYVVTAKANSGSIASTTGWTGTGTSATKSVTYKGTYGTLPSVSRTGYTLAGWNTKDDGTGTTITSSTTVNTASAHDIYAIWTPIVYHVTLNNQDATTSGTTDAYYRYSTVTNGCYYYSNSNLSTCLSNGYNIVLPTKTGYTFGGYFTEENGGGTQYVNASGSFVNNIYLTVGDKTLYAKWTANTYTITYNGNNNTSGTTATSTHTYDVEKTLTANGFVRTGYTFGGWSTSASDKSLIIDDTEYHQDSTSITSRYQELKQYSLAGPFTSGEVYQLEFDAKGTGNLTTYFYGVSGYLQVSNVTNSDGWNGSGSDGNNNVVLTSNYKHYSVRFTLGSTGDGTKTKYVLLRAIKGNDCYAKNIRFFKVSSTSTAYTNEQSVKNLATTGNVNLYAMWLANELTFGNQTITKTFSTSSQTANVTAATNGTGTYTYSKVSGESDITVSSAGVITVPASKTASPTTGYSVVIRATDSNSGKTKDATYTIKINKKKGTITLTDSSKALTYPTAGSNAYNYDGDGTVSCSSSDTTYVTCNVDTTNHKINVTPVKPTSSAVTITVSAGAGTNYSATDNKTFTVTVAKGTLTATATALNAAYTGSAQYAKIKVTKSDWDGKTIVSGTSTSYGTTVTSTGAYNTNYDLKPGYTNVQASTTIYFKITGGTYYNDLEGSTTAQITQTTTTTSLSAITKTYNGSAQAASGATAKLANNTAISNAAFTYTYYSGDSCAGTALSSAPTAAGTYSVKATLTATTNYASSTSSCVKYTMNKRDVTLTAGSTSRAWNGSALTNSTCSGNNLVSGHTVTCAMTSGSTITLAGSVDNVISTYSIKSGTTDLTNNYNVTTAKGTLTVTVATPTVSLTAKETAYTGSAIAANTATVSPNSNPTITYTYYTDSSCSTKTGTTVSTGLAASAGSAPVVAGQYYVKASAAAVANKTAAADSACTSHKITQKAITVTAGSSSRAWNNAALTNSNCTANAIGTGDAITCAMTSASTITTAGSVDNVINTVTIKKGTTDVTSSYSVTKAKGTLTVTVATPTVTLTAKTDSQRTYTGSAIAANTATVSPNSSPTITYKYYTDSACSAGETTTAPTNYGTYYVKAYAAAVTNKTAAASSACVNHSILKAAGTNTIKITGTNTWGSTLTATITTNSDGAKGYQWYYSSTAGATSGGTAISGATSATYTIDKSLIGKYIYVVGTVGAGTNWNAATDSVAATDATNNGTQAVAKKTCPAPTNVAIATDKKVSWTNASGASSYQISMASDSGFAAHTNGAAYNSITAATGTRTVYVRSVCDTTYYSAANSANASKSVTVYSVTLTKGTGISAVSGAGNYINGASITISATVSSGYTWTNWTGTSTLTSNSNSITVNGNKSYTANATINSYVLTVNPNGGSFNGSTSNTTYTQNYNTLKVLPLPTRTGYTFAGWTKTGSGTVTKYGIPKYTEPLGNISVYNNSGGGTVTHTTVARSEDSPILTSSNMLKIQTTGTASPGLGGFVQNTSSYANAVFYHVIVAKIPVGYTINDYKNATGTGRTITWLTSQAGTGKFEVYIYKHQCGSSGSFSTFGHVAINGTAATSSNPVTWYVAYANIFDATTSSPENTSQVFTYGAGNTTLTAGWTANELTFENQTITKTFSTSSQTANVTAATNGTGTYTYSKVSGESDITVSSAGVITVPASKTVNTTGYSVVIRATDSNSGKTKDATYVIKINKANCPAPTNVAIATDKKVSWTNATGASSYQISMSSDSGFEAHTNGAVYNSITEATGTRTVYVRSVCSTTYYSAANSANASKSTTVYSVTLAKGTGIKSVSGAGNYITGATVTLGATADTGYTWSKWTQTTGGSEVSTTNAYSAAITGNWAFTANATANPYTVTAKANSGSIASTTGWTGTGTSATKSVTYKGTYGTLPSVSRTGYTLAGWNTKDDGTGTTITSSTTVNTASAHDIYAIWVPSEISLADKTLSAGTYGTAYTSNAFDAATNGTGSYTYTLSNAPTGATINSTNRTISFTASTAAGTYNVTVTATDNETSKTDSATMTIVINKRNVTLTAGSTSRAWNNQALTNNTCTGNNLVSGHTVTCTMTSGSTITLAGSVDNVISTYSIKSGTTDLTSNYNVTTAKGTLTVTVATPTVTLTAKTDAQRTYTGSAIAANTATVSPNSTPTITYKYYTDSACSAGETTTAPTNAGTYYVKAYAAAVTNKTAAASSTCVNHSILKAAATNTVAITGTNTWGSTLTATITTNSDGAKGYQWYYSSTAGATSGGTAISGATSATYTIDKSLIGKYIYVVGTVGAGTNWNAATNSVDATDATTNTTQAVDKKTLSVTRTNYSAQYDAAAHGVIVKVNNSDWDGKTIVSGTSTSYGTTVTSTGAYNTNYTLSPTYTDYAASARTVYYKVTGGSYYKDYTGSGTVTISKKTATNTIKITGTNTWGSTLTATLTTNSNGTKSYKWYYSSTAGATSGGTAVGDTNCNTGSTCVIPQSLVGKYIYVVGSVGASTNYTTPADSVDATDATANGTQAVAKKTGTNSIKITGTNTWGSTLTATITTNSDGAKSYKWYYSSTAGATSGGTTVGATNCNTGSTCVIPNTLVGKYIYVVGTVGASSYYTTPSDSVDATDATTNTTEAVAKKTCPAPTNVAIATDKKVSWTNATGASSYQISIDGTTFAAHTNGAAYNSITAATGTRTVYVRSVCDTTYYSAANSANASKSTTVYSVTLTAGTGVSAVSGAGNYITGASASIDATVKTGYTWTNWTGSSTITTKSTSVTVNDNKSYTANATANTYTLDFVMNGGTNQGYDPDPIYYDTELLILRPTKTFTLNFDANSQGATIKNDSGTVVSSFSILQTFKGWTSTTIGDNALAKGDKISDDYIHWDGSLFSGGLLISIFKNLRESGTVTMIANWDAPITILPNITKSGYLCGYSTTASGNIEYYSGDSYASDTTTNSATLYAKCVQYDYTIAYTMNGGELPSSHPEGVFTNQDVYISNPSTKNVTINFNNTQGATIKNSSNQTITSMTSSQTFKGWTSSSYQSNAKTGTTANPTTAWTGFLTKNTHFKDLRNSGTIYMVANWNSSSITLPNATLSGRNCGYAPFDTSNIEYSNGQSYSVGTTLDSKTLYVRCLMAENLEYNTNLGSGSGLANTTFESLNNLDYYHEDAQYALDVIADFLK